MKGLILGIAAVGLSALVFAWALDEDGKPAPERRAVVVESLAAARMDSDGLRAAVRSAWPEDATTAEAILLCESRAGEDPGAWDPSRADGGPMQLNRATWEEFFREEFGWTWDRVVLDLDVHLAAAMVVYVRTGGWDRWACSGIAGG